MNVSRACAEIAHLLNVKSLTSQPLVTAHFYIAKQSHGAIIGSGGTTLQSLQSKSNTFITIPKKDDPNAGDVVTVEGTQTDINTLKPLVEAILQVAVVVKYPTSSGSGGGDQKNNNKMTLQKIDLKTGLKAGGEVLLFPDGDSLPGAGHFNRFLQVLQSATKTCDIAIYTLTDDRISRVIEDLHNSGTVKVRILTESTTVNDTGADVIPLMKLGLSVRVDSSPFLMHHKFVVIDNTVIITGSFNWTRSAAAGNAENVLILSTPDVVKPFATEFNRLWAAGTVLTPQNAAACSAQKKGLGGAN